MSLINEDLSKSMKVFSLIKEYSQRRNYEKIVSQLLNNEISLKEAKLSNNYYLAAIIKTIEAVQRASCAEKMNLLKYFFIACETKNIILDKPDFYQEILSIFSELSYRELLILTYLYDAKLPFTDDTHVKTPEICIDNDSYPNPQVQYEQAISFCSNKMMIEEDMLCALLGRLARTGLIGNAPEWTSLVFFFTPLYREVKDFLSMEYYQ